MSLLLVCSMVLASSVFSKIFAPISLRVHTFKSDGRTRPSNSVLITGRITAVPKGNMIKFSGQIKHQQQ